MNGKKIEHLGDVQQLLLDLGDATARLDRVRRAVAARDEWEQTVRVRSNALKEARRKLREATWDLSVALIGARRAAPGEAKEVNGGDPPCPAAEPAGEVGHGGRAGGTPAGREGGGRGGRPRRRAKRAPAPGPEAGAGAAEEGAASP